MLFLYIMVICEFLNESKDMLYVFSIDDVLKNIIYNLFIIKF